MLLKLLQVHMFYQKNMSDKAIKENMMWRIQR